jgi:integrase
VRLHEKGGKRHEMPAHHTLEAYLDTYIEAAGIRDGTKTPLFRSAAGRTGILTETAMNRIDAYRMVRRRATDLGTRLKIGCHTFRATGIATRGDRHHVHCGANVNRCCVGMDGRHVPLGAGSFCLYH